MRKDQNNTDQRTDTEPTASADWRGEYAANEAVLPDEAPTADDLAAELDVECRRLIQFVDFHPDPSPSNVLGWATGDPRHREDVAAWLADRDRRQREKAAKVDAGALPTDARSVWGDS